MNPLLELSRVAVIILILFIINACKMSSLPTGGGMGATPGGVQLIQEDRYQNASVHRRAAVISSFVQCSTITSSES